MVCLALGKTWGKEWNRLSPLHCMCWGGNGCTQTSAERAFLLVSQVMHQNPFLESEKEFEVNLN